MATVTKVEDEPNEEGLNVKASTVGDDSNEPVDPGEYKKDELQEKAESLDLSTSGTKQDIADRINEHDESTVHKPEAIGPYEAE